MTFGNQKEIDGDINLKLCNTNMNEIFKKALGVVIDDKLPMKHSDYTAAICCSSLSLTTA